MKLASKILLLTLFCAKAQAADVFGRDRYFVQVTESADKSQVKFELCSLMDRTSCDPIGSKDFYSKKKLKELRSSEKWDVLTSSAADIAIVIASAFTGGAAAFSVATTDAGMIYGTMAGASASGAMGGAVTMGLVDGLNPYEQYKQLETLDDGVLNDHIIIVDYDVATFAKRLGAVLDNL